MWRVLVFFLVAQYAVAGSIKLSGFKYDKETNEIRTNGGSVFVSWQPEEMNRAVFELNYLGEGHFTYQVADGDFMFHMLKALTQLDPHPIAQLDFTRKLRFYVDNDDKPLSSDNVIIRFEDITLVDSTNNLYSYRCFALDTEDLQKKFSTTKNGLNINQIDPQGDLKFIFTEDDKMVYYWTFFFNED